MKRLVLLSFLILLTQVLFSQNISDALRYSYLQPGGTARFLGAGGAFGALGADYGVLSTNPAGLAMFRTNELVFTPALRFATTEATLRGSGNASLDDSKSNFNFNNIGIVFSTKPRNTSARSRWTTFNVGIGYNKQANFHSAVYYEGKSKGSILNRFYTDAKPVLDAGGAADDLYPFAEKLAYDANAIYPQNGVWTYDFAGNEQAVINRNQAIITTGHVNEMVVSFAGNYDEKLMLGATVGVPFVKYEFESTYEESNNAGAVPYFNDLKHTEYLRTNGIGVNLKLGVIYKVNQMIRLGAALHTPTAMSLTDNYENTFQYAYTDSSGTFDSGLKRSPNGTFDYKLRTPWRAMFSGALVLKKYGFLSADIELVDYAAGKFNLTSDVNNSDNQQTERDLNNDLRRAYQQAVNMRFGGEAALDKLRLRAGINMLGKPGEGKDGFDVGYSAGVGIRGDVFYLDMGFRRSAASASVAPYTDPIVAEADQPVASTKSRLTDILLTVGLKF